MTKPQLFSYAIIWHPTEEQAKEGKKSIVVVQPTTVLANSQANAATIAARAIPEDYITQLDQVDIAIRPF